MAGPAPPPVCIDFDDGAPAPLATSFQGEEPARDPLSAGPSAIAERGWSRASIVARTVHLRCLPTGMLQKDLGAIVHGCGKVCRVRICGNAPTGQNWVYGFVEYATSAEADRLMMLAGMELENGEGKPPLRLKCSRAKQPIVDVLPQDADVVKGTPCLFGRDDSAENCINDAVLVVHRGAGAANGREAAAPVGTSTPAVVGGRDAAAHNGCDCGCADDPFVRCCSCCKCHELRNAQEAGNTQSSSSCCGGRVRSQHPSPMSLVQGAPAAGTVASSLSAGDDAAWSDFDLRRALAATQGGGGRRSESPSLRLSSLVKGMLARKETLDGDQIIESARATFLRGMHEAKAALSRGATAPYSSASAGDGLARATHSFLSALVLLDQNAALVGGAASTVAGDPDSLLPQRATQLRMVCLLSLVLLSLLRRCLSDAVPYLDALTEVVNAVPAVPITPPAPTASATPVSNAWPLAVAEPSATRESEYDMFGSGGVSDDFMRTTQQIMPLVMEDDDDEAKREEGARHPHSAAQTLHGAAELLQYQRDVHFNAALLNILVAVGLALEEVQPQVALSTYALASERALLVLGMRNKALDDCIASASGKASSAQAHHRCLSDALPSIAAALDGPTLWAEPRPTPLSTVRDITALPRAYFLTFPPSNASGTAEGVWESSEAQPPMHLVRLFPC